jgi:tetratricopeptide (TPR) repeat protein
MDLGDIYKMLGDIEKAQKTYEKVLETDRDNQEALYELNSLTVP